MSQPTASPAAPAKRKPFKETRFGMLLKQKLPKALALVGDLLPSNGVYGVIKNTIDLATPAEIAPEDKAALLAELEHERRLFELETQDRASARSRETEVIKSGNADWLTRNLTSLLAVSVVALSFLFFYLLCFTHSLDALSENIAMFISGSITSALTAVLSYYFGSSHGSSRKQTQIEQLMGRPQPPETD